ncbi:Leucine-rich repeat containing protein [Entamoeba marina]
MGGLETVYLMNVILYFNSFVDFFNFLFISKKCRNAIYSIRKVPWYTSNHFDLFCNCETLTVDTVNLLPTIIPQSVKRVICKELPILSTLSEEIKRVIVSGIGFPNDLEECVQLENLHYLIHYNFNNINEVANVLKLPWNEVLKLPKLKRVIISCSHQFTPFPFNNTDLSQFNDILVQLVKILSSHGYIQIYFKLHECNDSCVTQLIQFNQVSLLFTKELCLNVISSLLNQTLIIDRVVTTPLHVIYSQVCDGSFEQLVKLYLPIHVIVHSSIPPELSPNTSSESSDETITSIQKNNVYYDFTQLTSLQQFEITIDTKIDISLPTSLHTLTSNVNISNLMDLSLSSLYLSSSQLNTITFPITLTSLQLEGSKISFIERIPFLKTLSCRQCDQLTTIQLPETLTTLELLSCCSLTTLILPTSLQTVTLMNCGLSSLVLPITIWKCCIDTTIQIENIEELPCTNSFSNIIQ